MVDGAVKEAFQKNFGISPFDLYKTLYELEMMNFYSIPPNILNLVTNGPKWLNISDELPTVNPDELIFRIEKIKITKNGIVDSFYYKGLSDGEHQFLQVVGIVMMLEESGCLFLLDEPDTHFNTVWRSKLVSTINMITKVNSSIDYDKNRLQEIFITTHSPFILSDLRKRNVFLFKKQNNKLSFEPCPIETYGASASIILDELFGKVDSISEKANSEFNEMLSNIKSLEDLRLIINKLNTRFGDSVEKFDMFNKLSSIKQELEKNNSQ